MPLDETAINTPASMCVPKVMIAVGRRLPSSKDFTSL